MHIDATFWAFVGLVIFLAIIFKVGVPAKITAALDSRADKIRDELEEAKRLREEAQQLMAEYQRKRKEAEEEAKEILEIAKRDADSMKEEARSKSEEYVVRRQAMAEQKIAQAESDAVAEVRSTAVDVAIAAAEKLMGDKITTRNHSDLFKASLTEVKERMN